MILLLALLLGCTTDLEKGSIKYCTNYCSDKEGLDRIFVNATHRLYMCFCEDESFSEYRNTIGAE